MNKICIFRFPEVIKKIYQKHFPSDTSLTYGNLPEKLDYKLTSAYPTETITYTSNGIYDVSPYATAIINIDQLTVNENDIIPGGDS